MLSSYTVNIAYHSNNPNSGMSLEKASTDTNFFYLIQDSL